MPVATKREETEYKLPDDAYFPGKLIEVKEVEIPYFKKDKAGNKTNEQAVFTKWEWKFEVTAGEFEGEIVRGDTEAEYTTREDNRVRQWGEVLLGRELEVGEELDTDALLELPCMFSVKHLEPKEKKDGSGFWYNYVVDEVLPRAGGLTDAPPPF